MEAFLALFMFGTFFWWVLLLAFLGFILFLEEKDNGLIALAAIAGYTLILQYLCKTDIFGYMTEHPWKTAALVIGYFTVGLLMWAPFKWNIFAKYKNTIQYKKDRRKFINEQIKLNKITKDIRSDDIEIKAALIATPMPDVFKEKWAENVNGKYPVRAMKYKEEIARWATYWPMSAFWFLSHDAVEKVVENISSLFQKISNRSFKSSEDFK